VSLQSFEGFFESVHGEVAGVHRLIGEATECVDDLPAMDLAGLVHRFFRHQFCEQ
jgi:hypothetical protein